MPPVPSESVKPLVVIEANGGARTFDFAEFWEYRQLLLFFIWRDTLLRYKQTMLGALWEIVKPLSFMIIYSVFLGYVLRISTDGIPYPLFYYSGLVIWGFFAQAVTAGSASVVSSANLVNKVYFPRIILPVSAVLSNLVDLMIASLLLIFLMLYYKVTPSLSFLLVPFPLLVAVLTSLGIALLFSALIARFRDFQNVLTVGTTLWMFLTPIIYPVSMVPENWQWLYSFNPMTAATTGFRWALLGSSIVDWRLLLPGSIMALVIFVAGLVTFTRSEKSFPHWL